MNIVPQLIVNSIIAASLYSLLAIGFNLIYKVGKFFDLGFGALVAVGAYIVFWLSQELGAPAWLAVICGILGTGALGYVLYHAIYKVLRRRNASVMILLVASLGVFTALQAFLAIIFTSQFQTLNKSIGEALTYTVMGGIITQVQLITLITMIVVFVATVLVLRKTSFGKAVRAIGDDEEVSQIVGINANKIIGLVFLIGSAIAGLSGILFGYDTGIEPVMGMPLLLKGVIAAIIGGIGNVYGSILGGVLLGFIENFGIWKISGEWKDAIAFGLLIIFLIFRPYGILGEKTKQ